MCIYGDLRILKIFRINFYIFVSILFCNLVQSIRPTTCRSMFSEANACARVAGSGENCKLVGSVPYTPVSRFGLAVRLVSRRTLVRYCFGSPFSSKRLWFVDTVLWLCPSLPTGTLKWLTSLPILMQKSFWWWQCSDRYIIFLSPCLHAPFPPFSPSLISRTVSVDIKHHVYFTYTPEKSRVVPKKCCVCYRAMSFLSPLTKM